MAELVTYGGLVINGSNRAVLIDEMEGNTGDCVVKCSNSLIVRTKSGGEFINDIPLDGYYSKNDWNEDGSFNSAGGNTLISTGMGSITIPGISTSDNRYYCLGDSASIALHLPFEINNKTSEGEYHQYKTTVNAVFGGSNAQVFGDFGLPNLRMIDSQFVLLGEDCNISTGGIDCTIAMLGDNSSLSLPDTANDKYVFSGGLDSSIYVSECNEDNINSTQVLVAQKAKSVLLNREAIFMALEGPECFSVGVNSVVAIGWHDGVRKRIAVFYEGQDIEAGKKYRVNENGQAVEIN